jgi:hypothetical protein
LRTSLEIGLGGEYLQDRIVASRSLRAATAAGCGRSLSLLTVPQPMLPGAGDLFRQLHGSAGGIRHRDK